MVKVTIGERVPTKSDITTRKKISFWVIPISMLLGKEHAAKLCRSRVRGRDLANPSPLLRGPEDINNIVFWIFRATTKTLNVNFVLWKPFCLYSFFAYLLINCAFCLLLFVSCSISYLPHYLEQTCNKPFTG